MRHHRVLTATIGPLLALLGQACVAEDTQNLEAKLSEEGVQQQGGSGWAGGGGDWGGGGGQWGGGGGLWGGGGGFWGGGGGLWGGGGGSWGGGGGQWGGGGGYWGGGGGWWGGGGGLWGGGGGLWGGGFANTFPFLGWTYARHWNFRGVPKAGYTFNPAAPPTFSVAKDTAACAAGQVRLGGFAYAIDVDGWPGFVALGYNQKLCIPTPASAGLIMNSTIADPSIAQAGGYTLTGDLQNSANDVQALKSMVGWGSANVATQFGGALCASIGSLAAAKRSCGVGIAFSDPNKNRDGSLSQRGASLLGSASPASGAQVGVASYNTPFGRAEGHSLYGVASNDMESYASQVLRKHTTKAAPSAPSAIDAWNNANSAGFAFNGSNFANVPMAASGNDAKLQSDAIRSVSSPLNMVPVDGVGVLAADMAKSVRAANGDLYALSLHSLAFHQSPLYGSGGGRWFFHDPADPNGANKPLLDLSSVFQGSNYILSGQLSGTTSTATLGQPYISPLTIGYADWHAEPASGTLYIDRAGQTPSSIGSDDDKEARLAAGLNLPPPRQNVGHAFTGICAITSAGGAMKCWGRNNYGQLGMNDTNDRTSPTQVVNLSEGASFIGATHGTTCAGLTDGTVKCWGINQVGQLDATGISSLAPTPMTGLNNVTGLGTGGRWHTCALTSDGLVKCWGGNNCGQVGAPATGPCASVSDDTKTPNAPYNPPPGVVVPLADKATAIGTGEHFSCAVLVDGRVQCWGINLFGQLGNGTVSSYNATPTFVQGLTAKAVSVGGGYGHACALLVNGKVQCWGDTGGGKGYLGNNSTLSTPSTTAVHVLQDTAGTHLSGVASLSVGSYATCAVTTQGAVKCWGYNTNGAIGDGTTTHAKIAVSTLLNATATGVATGYRSACARLSNGNMKCWGDNSYGQMGIAKASTKPVLTPVDVTGGTVNNGSLVTSQGSVLATKYTAASGSIAGHITPIAWSMSRADNRKQALMVTYDPLAVAAAEFIEQYDAHIAACTATTTESITEAEQQAGTKLWACSNPTAKSNYLTGMQTFLLGARSYLFGRSDGCIQSAQTVAGAACPSTLIDYANAHLPFTFVVPDYTSASYNPEYYAQVDSALTTYRSNIIASTATRLERTLQLTGLSKFTTNNAVVTSRITRGGNYGTTCIVNDGFTHQ